MHAVDKTPWLVLPADTPATLDDALMVSLILAGVPSQVSLADAGVLLSGQAVVLVLPVERASFTLVSLPPGRPALQRQALPYAVEPSLAQDVEQLHLALGTPLADGRWPVAAINAALLRGWLDQLASRGVSVARIHVDADLLPGTGTVLWWDAQRCLLGGTGREPMVFAPAHWPMLQGHYSDARVLVAADADPAALAVPAGLPLEPAQWPLLLQAGQAGAIDLAQAAFAPSAAAGKGRWHWLAAALAAVVVLQLGMFGVQGWVHDKQAQAYRQANLAIYHGLFPQDTRVVSLRAQFDQHLQRQQAGSELMAQLARLDAALPAPLDDQLQAIGYRAGERALQLTLQPGSSQALAQVGDAIAAGQLAINVHVAGQPASGDVDAAAGAAP